MAVSVNTDSTNTTARTTFFKAVTSSQGLLKSS
jgi:hypothetical protein